jgi:hypothetical protein
MRLPLIFSKVNDLEARVTSCKVVENIQGAIGRAIVDTNHLNIAKRLALEGAKTLGKKRLGVVDGNEDGNLTHGDGNG